MELTNYNLYGIDAADIWQYECDSYMLGKQESTDKDSINELYEFLQQFYLAAKIEPFIQSSDESPYADGYRKKYKERESGAVCLNFFFCAGRGYAMAHPCEVFKKDYNGLEFQRLFILKLRQYHDGLLHVDNFLRYQLKVNFKNKPADLQKFIKLSLLQYPSVIDSRITNIIDDWFLEIEKKKIAKALKPVQKRNKAFHESESKETGAVNGDTIIQEPEIPNVCDEKQMVPEQSGTNNQEIISESVRADVPIAENSSAEAKRDPALVLSESKTEDTIPEGYEPIPGNFTKEEIIHFFSFLYQEKSKEGKSFLRENELGDIFKYGLSIPPTIPEKRYKLTFSDKYPKGIIEHCIYKFVVHHTSSHDKRKVLRFFASYIIDFGNALESNRALNLWSNNVTGKRPARMTFRLSDYLPERFKEAL